MSYYGGMQPGLVTPGMGMGMGMPMSAGMGYGTPYGGNALMMSGLGSEYGGPMVDPYQPTIARTPSMYGGSRSLYGDDYYDRDRYYDDDYYGSRRHSRRSRRRDYDDYYNDRDYDYDYDDYDRGYYPSGYDRSHRYRSSSYYPSSSRYYSSSSGRRREDLSVIRRRDGGVKVLRNGEERLGDKFRRLLGIDPKGVNIVRLKRGESIATGLRH
jgi:hypothetical protein